MITLVIGTPDSGKSDFAESLLMELKQDKKLAYIATMVPFDDAGIKRIEKHREKRKGKGFITYEKATAVDELASEFKKDGISIGLLECVSNLSGNEIYAETNQNKDDSEVVEIIVSELSALSREMEDLVIVANYFDLEESFDEETVRYINIQNQVTDRLKEASDRFYIKEGDSFKLYENH